MPDKDVKLAARRTARDRTGHVRIIERELRLIDLEPIQWSAPSAHVSGELSTPRIRERFSVELLDEIEIERRSIHPHVLQYKHRAANSVRHVTGQMRLGRAHIQLLDCVIDNVRVSDAVDVEIHPPAAGGR